MEEIEKAQTGPVPTGKVVAGAVAGGLTSFYAAHLSRDEGASKFFLCYTKI